MSNEKSKTVYADIYTVEPGYDECSRYLRPGVGGGIGAVAPKATKYYSYTGVRPSFQNFSIDDPGKATFGPLLGDFLSMMNYVDEDVRFYCTTSRENVTNYVRSYLECFFTSSQARGLESAMSNYLRKHNVLESGYTQNVVLGTPFYNDIFYETSWMAAQSLFSGRNINSLQRSFMNIRGFDSSFPAGKAFVNYFDGAQCLNFYFDAPNECCRMDDTLFIVSKDFHCSRHDFEQSVQPFILFLSNWSLVLACYLCMHSFGQCAFGIYWETGGLALLQERQKRAWWSSKYRR